MAASKQARTYVYTHTSQCSHTSLGLAQARPNYLKCFINDNGILACAKIQCILYGDEHQQGNW